VGKGWRKKKMNTLELACLAVFVIGTVFVLFYDYFKWKKYGQKYKGFFASVEGMSNYKKGFDDSQNNSLSDKIVESTEEAINIPTPYEEEKDEPGTNKSVEQ
jgi:hypothetical protein